MRQSEEYPWSDLFTDEKKMRLNQKKSKAIIFNFTNNYQFSTRLYMQGELLEIVQSTKLLGTVISSDLTWWENTNYLTRKGYQRLELIRRLYQFKVPTIDLVAIYTLYVRSMLEFSCCVWHFNITQEESSEMERVQKVACRIILKENYLSYENALNQLKWKTRIFVQKMCTKISQSHNIKRCFPSMKMEGKKSLKSTLPGTNAY